MRQKRIEKTIEEFRCDAPEVLFGEWSDVPAELKAQVEKQRGLPCDGGGNPGEWCSDCRWTGGHDVLEYDDDYDYGD